MSLPYPLFEFEPDFETPPRYSTGNEVDRLAIAPAPAFGTFPTAEPDRVFVLAFSPDSRNEIRAMKSFFRERGGKALPFYLPSWRDDFVAISGSALTLVVLAQTIPAGHGSDYQRQVFVWQDGVLHVSRWIKQTTGGGSTTFTLEDPLPFTVKPEECLAGWVHLVAFADDRISWKHKFHDFAEASIVFRSPRQWSNLRSVDAVVPIAHNRSPGFALATAEEDALAPYDGRVVYAQGPATLHSAGALNSRWAAWSETAGGTFLKKTAGTITRPDGTGTASDLSGIANTPLALAFLHTGNEVIAYQDGDAISIVWHTGGGGWTGYNPVLVNNFFTDTGMPTGEAEVVCYYLKPGKNVLYARYSSEDFDTEHVAALLPFKPLELRGLSESDHTTLLFADTSWRLVSLTIP